MQSNQPKKLRAIIKSVISPEIIQLVGLNKSKTGQTLIKKLFLIGVQGPRCASAGDEIEKEEPLGFEAREFLRKNLVGKQVSFFVEQKIGDREFGHIELDDQDISANFIFNHGFGTINENQLQQFSQKNQIFKPLNYDQYVKAQQKAKSDKAGVWADGSQKKIRQFKALPSTEEIIEKYGKVTLTGVFEQVQHKFIVVYIFELQNFLKVVPIHVQLPSQDWKEYKLFVEEHLHQKDIKITQLKEDLGCCAAELLNDTFDLKLTLLKEGFGKLDMNCINDVDMNRFKSLQEAFDTAQSQKLRIWKDLTEDKKASKKITGSGYAARVLEVHSGESITIEQQGKEPFRLFLANLKAPLMGNPIRGEPDKPWAFESKEFLRKLIIGKNVTVEPEFTKTFIQQNEESKEERTKTFATIFLGDQNISTVLIENGLAQVSMPRATEDCTKYLKQLKDTEEVAKGHKKGLFNTELVKAAPKFNDLTQQKNQKNTKSYFEFLKEEKNIQGMIDLVLNGSRFKVRLDKQNTYIILVLEGVRCLPNDQNVKEFAYFSNEAMKYSKANIFQRDVEFEVASVDQKGTFHGTIFFNKKNYAAELLEQGLAQCFSTRSHKNSALYHELEAKAKQQQKGMWKENIQSLMGQTNQIEGVKKINETKQMIVADIQSAQEFYLQDTKNKSLQVIEETLKAFNHKTEQPLANPIKKGTPCVALWDGAWYRAKILNDKPKGSDYLVQFVDFGNTDYINIQDIRKIPAKLNQFDPCAVKCSLAYLTTPSLDHPSGDDAATKLRDWIWGQQLKAQLVYVSQGSTFVVLYIGDKKISVNEVMLFDGYAKLSRDVELPKEYVEWSKQQDIAEEKKKGMWNFDDENADDEDY